MTNHNAPQFHLRFIFLIMTLHRPVKILYWFVVMSAVIISLLSHVVSFMSFIILHWKTYVYFLNSTDGSSFDILFSKASILHCGLDFPIVLKL